MQKGAQEKTQDGPRRLEEVAQEGSKRPSEGPKEPQEAPTVQMRLNPWTLPSARNLDVAICPHILRLGSGYYGDASAPLTHSAASLAHSRPLILRLTQTQAH